jgi:hypothetical protein
MRRRAFSTFLLLTWARDAAAHFITRYPNSMLAADVAQSALASNVTPVFILLLPNFVLRIVNIWFWTRLIFEAGKSLQDIDLEGRARDAKALQDVSKG